MRKVVLCDTLLLLMAVLTGCHEHVWKDATCLEPKTCTECGETEGEALGHTWADATCTSPRTCTRCKETEGSALGHTEGEWTVVTEASCSEEGNETAVCTVCGETLERSVEKLPHTPSDWVVTTPAAWDTAGERTQTCTVCGETVATERYNLTPEEAKAAYIAGCKSYSYKTIARNPDEYKGTYAKYTGEIVQVIEGYSRVQLRVDITYNGYFYTDTIYVEYSPKEGEGRLLEDDIVVIYGVNSGTKTYETVMGSTLTIPFVKAEYIDLK